MTENSIADAKNHLTRLIHQAEAGEPVHITRRGKPVAVLLFAREYARMRQQLEGRGFWSLVEEMRAEPGFTAVDLTPEEVAAWRNRETGREFSWPE
jgi:prevent-host-death family protein